MARDSWLKRLIWLRGSPAGGSGASYEKTVGPAPIISIADAKAKPAKSLIVGMEPIQAGSGDPSPDNIRPITGRTGVTVERTGDNLIPFDDVLSDGWTNTLDGVTATYNGGVMHISGTHNKSGWTNVVNLTPWSSNPIGLPSGITIRTPQNPSNTTSLTMFSVVDGVAKNLTNGSVINAGEKAWVRGFYIAVQGEVTFDFDIPMIVTYGDERPTEYEPYVGASYPVVFPASVGTVYGGTVDVVTGVLTVTHAKRPINTEWAWTKSTSYPGGFYYTIASFGYKHFTPFICTHARSVSSVSDYVGGTCYCDDSLNFRLMPTDGSASVDDWKSYIDAQSLAGNPIEICYELATPITYQLTPTQIQMLKGANVLWSDGDSLTLTYLGTTPENLLGGMLGGGFGGGYNPPAEQDPDELTEPEATKTDVPAEETPAEEGENNGE